MKKILIIIGAGTGVMVAGLVLLFLFARQAPPELIVANFTELDKIEKISKYRSCAGHTTVPQDGREMKRSMKHYFTVKKEYLGGNTVAIYAPFDGFVTSIREARAEGLEGEIWIAPKNIFVILPPIDRWNFSVQHINLLQGLKRGDEVKAGELIGYAAVEGGIRNTFDVLYVKGAPTTKRIDNWEAPFLDLDSVFNYMSDAVFAQFQAKGVNAKENLIISKEERDIKPCVYMNDGPYFLNQEAAENWVELK